MTAFHGTFTGHTGPAELQPAKLSQAKLELVLSGINVVLGR